MLSDEELVRNILSGHKESYSYLVNKYKNMVLSVCLRILENKKEAEDMLCAEIKETLEVESSDDFTQNVMHNIEYKMIRKNQMITSLSLIALLMFLLLSVIILFYFDGIYHIRESVNIRFSASIWSYKFVPVVMLSLSIIFLIDKILTTRKK